MYGTFGSYKGNTQAIVLAGGQAAAGGTRPAVAWLYYTSHGLSKAVVSCLGHAWHAPPWKWRIRSAACMYDAGRGRIVRVHST